MAFIAIVEMVRRLLGAEQNHPNVMCRCMQHLNQKSKSEFGLPQALNCAIISTYLLLEQHFDGVQAQSKPRLGFTLIIRLGKSSFITLEELAHSRVAVKHHNYSFFVHLDSFC